ncbi:MULTISPECIES: 2-hydroxyacyl-CoA dehydratase family protein [Clostridiaceae]|uniref:2-hydroxyacyl-CoA dehydratase n=1 Tax=Clostridiaceae TaxID=31979 RepID=UPI00055094FE|nr:MULTISPECIES: 2-hydroxyacyl-CoA dehydratase family protein [Clostridiaceae]
MNDIQHKQIESVNSILSKEFSDMSMSYFLNVWKEYWNKKINSDIPNIVVIDTGIPDIYIRALNINTHYIFGGVYQGNSAVQEVFPQISDPIIKSAFSLLVSEYNPQEQQLTVVMPVHNITARKALPFLSEAKFNVLSTEQNIFLSKEISDQFIDEQNEVWYTLQQAVQKAVPAKELLQYAEAITYAYHALVKLEESSCPTFITSFIRQTYYMVSDLEKWSIEVEHLAERYPKNLKSSLLLLTGSPILFPNTKLLSILQSLSLKKYQNHCAIPKPCNYDTLLNSKGLPVNLLYNQLHEIHYQAVKQDISHTFSVSAAEIKHSNGVIYHLLKGQLFYAYEAEQVEKICIDNGIPFVLIETDYTDTDTEQIRIRLEAFAELLRQPSAK